MKPDLLQFISEVNRLKAIKRAGWIERGVADPESVADHCWRTALMVLILGSGRKNLNLNTAIKMALIHDLPDAITGDMICKESWPAGGQIGRAAKHRKELTAIKRLARLCAMSYLVTLWKEYERGKSPEARFVRQIDKAEMVLQALEYQRRDNFKKPLDGFWDRKNLSYIKDSKLKLLIEQALKSK